MTISRTFRLFVSSTFSDFEAERKALQEHVFPELEEFCRLRGATFQAIDLRWGITEDAQREHETMRICLEELRRCQELSPKPNFVALLGDRYGWEPAPAHIPIDQWDRLVDAANPADGSLIRSGYIGPDLNAVPPLYQLRKRAGDQAIAHENALRDALRRAADSAGFDASDRIPYFTSATHQEIALGALTKKDASGRELRAEGHVYIYIRHINDLPNNADACRFIDWDEADNAPTAGASHRLSGLKGELCSRLPNQVREFHTRWSGKGIETSYLQEFCARFLEDQKAIIQQELDDAPIHDDAQRREIEHKNYAMERARNFQGRSEILKQIERHLNGSITANVPLLVSGGGGTGKSALIAQSFQNALTAAKGSVVIARFIGGSPGADSLYELLTNLVTDITEKFGHAPPPVAETLIEAREHFAWALGLSSAARPLLLFLDAIDQLNDREAELLLKWLPKTLIHTKLVVSCRSEKKLICSATCLDMNILELGALSPEDGRQLLDAWLSDPRDACYGSGVVPLRARALTLRQHMAVMDQFVRNGNPLWLKLAYEEARTWPSWHGDDNPKALELPDTIKGMVQDLINRRLLQIEKHSPVFTERALAYISAARFGLSEEELGRALATDKKVREEFQSQCEKNHHQWDNSIKLPGILWSRLYFDLQPYLAKSYSDGALVHRWFHREFKEQIEATFLKQDEQRRETHSHLARTFCDLAYNRKKLFLSISIGKGRQVPSLRRVMEQPWQLARAGERDKLNFLLRDFGFCLAKCAAGAIHDLEQDFSAAKMPSFASFIRSNKHILGRLTAIDGWPLYRVMLQLALEEDPSSGVFKAAQRWLSSGAADWDIVAAPTATPKSTSLCIRASEKQNESIRVGLDEDNNIIVMDESGLCNLYDGSDGIPLGTRGTPAEFLVQPNVPVLPPRGVELSDAWPVGHNRWFGWKSENDGGGPDGSAWLYAPDTEHWGELPRAHHDQVWFATGLPSGGFASLGLNSNMGALVIWASHEKREMIRIPHRPRHDLTGNNSGASGIVRMPNGSFLIWPFMDDGSGAYLKRFGTRGYWDVCALPGTKNMAGALPLPSNDGDVRFLTWTQNGEVRMCQSEELPRPVKQKIGGGLARGLSRGGVQRLEGDFSVASLHRGLDGTLYASENVSRSIWEWHEPEFRRASQLPEHARKLDECINFHTLSETWFSWKNIVANSTQEAFERYKLSVSDVRSAVRQGMLPPDEQSHKKWTALLLGLLEDQKSARPFFGQKHRVKLTLQVCELIQRTSPEDFFPALIQSKQAIEDHHNCDLPLERLLSGKIAPTKTLRALIALYMTVSQERALTECEKLIERFPQSWEPSVYQAMLQPEASTKMLVDASIKAGCPPIVRQLNDPENSGPWQIIADGKQTVWFSGQPATLKFHVTDQCVQVTGRIKDGIRELKFLN
jgi:hypothetical protein